MIPKIPKRAVKRFLARPRDDFRKWKERSLAWLQDRMERLPERPPIWKLLKKHQRVCLLIGAELRRFCYWNDTGTGKTLLCLSLMLFFRKIGLCRLNLVLVPNKVNKYEWVNDVRKHSPTTRILVLEGSSIDKWEALESTRALIAVETYGGLVHMLTETVMVKKKNKKAKPQFVISKKAIKRMRELVQGLYMDESIFVVRKSRHGSLIHRICKRLSNTCETAFALNGTPFGRDPTDMWGQVHIIDDGYALGETLALFRATFFTAKENYFGGPTYKFKKALEPLLHDLLADVSIRYEADAADLPHVVTDKKEVKLDSDAQAYYDRARDAVLAARGNYREMQNAFLRMRQVSSGFVGYYDDETGAKAKYTFAENPKLESLLSYIESIGGRYKSVVFHEFRYSGDMIAKELKALGIGHARIYGKTKDSDAQLNTFRDDPNCDVLLLQNSSGGYGLDRVKVAKYGLYFEAPVKTDLRKQTRRRIERQYSDHETVFIVDFVTRGTADQQILDAHEAGFDLFAAIVDGTARPD